MSALIASGSFAAYVLSLRGVWTGGDVYFESATAAVALATLGRYLEASARSYAAGAVGAAQGSW